MKPLLLMAGVLAALLLPGTASAQIFDGFQWGSSSGEKSKDKETADKEFIKDWEANPPLGFVTLSAPNIAATKDAIKKYEAIAAGGGWKTVPEVEVNSGDTHFVVAVLRDRLIASGELAADEAGSEQFDSSVEKAVKRFQATNGLTPTGNVDKRTLLALNVPAEGRLKQLKLNLARIQELAPIVREHKKYVLVNIPAAQVEAIESGNVVSRHTGVVGKPDRPTPLLRSTIVDLNFNPVWRLPPTVILKDLIPHGQRLQVEGKSVLAKFKIDAYSNGKKLEPETVDFNGPAVKGYAYSQQPGKENPLGFLKINFASSESVYMHDTPKDGLFGRNFRAASSGCIRVANIAQLATWLLEGNLGWSRDVVDRLKESGDRRDIRLKKPVPLYFAYISAWATPDGVIQFRRDLYNKDGVGEAATSY